MSNVKRAKTVTEFEILINFVPASGNIYNPSKEELKTVNLNNILTTAKNVLSQPQISFAERKDITNRRETAFDASSKILICAINSFSVSGAGSFDIDDAKSFVRKTRGRHASLKKESNITGKVVKILSAA